MCPPGDVLYFFTVNKKPVEDYGANTHQVKDPVVYGFDDEFLKEFNENEVKNNYYKQTEVALVKENLVNESGKKPNERYEQAEDGKEYAVNMSFNSNVTQVMGDDLIEVFILD